MLQVAEGTKPAMTSLDIQQDGKYYWTIIAPDFLVTKIELPFVPVKPHYRSDLTIGMAASIRKNAIFIASEEQKIYKYVPGEMSSLS